MKTNSRFLLAVSFGLALAFTFSCSDSDNVSSTEQSYNYCITADNTCLTGPFTASTCTGQLSNNCPNGSSSSEGVSNPITGGSSSSVGSGSSSSVAVVGSSSSVNGSSSPSVGGSKGNDIANYRTVQIGNQVWMAENLDYAVSRSRCYEDNEANCAIYGRLYNWATAMDLPSKCNNTSSSVDDDCTIEYPHQGICPDGWHIPSNAEWNVLMKTVNPSCSDNSDCAGAETKLKATNGWNKYGSNSVNGTDDYGFSALPGGVGLFVDGYFYSIGSVGIWWSSSEGSSGGVYGREMGNAIEFVGYYYNGKSDLLSVRCLQG